MQLVVEESNPGHDCGCRRRFWRFLGFPSVPPSVRTRHVSYYTADVSLVVAVAVDGGGVSDGVVFVVVGDMSLTTQRLRVLPLLLLLLMLYCNVVDVIFGDAVVVGDLLLHSGCESQLLLMTSWLCCCRCCWCCWLPVCYCIACVSLDVSF